jgi:hypothetical protein
MAAKDKGLAYALGAFIGTLIGFTITATLTTYVGLAVLNWLGLT